MLRHSQWYLTLISPLGIIATATLASIGSAAVPGAGMVMLVIVLAQAGIPEARPALIFAVDRPLDMSRTVVNVSRDAAVSMVVAKSVGKLRSVDQVNKKWEKLPVEVVNQKKDFHWRKNDGMWGRCYFKVSIPNQDHGTNSWFFGWLRTFV